MFGNSLRLFIRKQGFFLLLPGRCVGRFSEFSFQLIKNYLHALNRIRKVFRRPFKYGVLAARHGVAAAIKADRFTLRENAVIGQFQIHGSEPCPKQAAAFETSDEVKTGLEMHTIPAESPEKRRKAGMLFNQSHVHARLGKHDGGRHPGDAAAYDNTSLHPNL